MADNKRLEAGLRAMAKDFQLPGGGQKKLARVIADHLWWFDAAERRGMSWQDMVRAMTAAGVTSPGGKPLSVGTLSSTVWRKRLEVGATKTEQHPSRESRPGPPPTKSRQKHVRGGPRSPDGGQRQEKSAASPRAGGLARAHQPPLSRAPKPSIDRSPAQSTKDVLAFMDRARSVRRRSDEN